ncbi:MAG: phospholipase [Tannerella sp.]|jgi:hypothetical protein|nr:phospholipase [Tannerella sp.]
MLYLLYGIIILGIITALIGYFGNRKRQQTDNYNAGAVNDESMPGATSDCCGQHEVCERDSLPAAMNKEIEYYDDEELDVYCHTASDKYGEREVNEFREVLYTLPETEVAGWIRSLQLRNINLPDQLKDEVFLIVEEQYKNL